MTTIADLQRLTNSPATQALPSARSEVQDRFLKLLVTQMQNQDPLNPMDNAQVTTQLAQLNTVSGIEQLNKTLGQMAAASAAQQALQAAMLVGRDVLVAGDKLNFTGQAARFGIEVPQAVDSLTITITDSKGQVVQSFQAGAQAQGATTFQWDGLDNAGNAMAPGTYGVAATARAGSATVTPVALVDSTVQSVGSAADGSIELQLFGLGSVGIADIKRFL